MNGLPYYKRYPRDFIEGTIGMPFELKVTYSFVLDLIYMQGGKLPDDPRYISGLLGVSVRKWKSLREGLIEAGKVQAIEDYLTNYRAVSELETLAKLSRKQSENRSRPNKNNDLESPTKNHTEPEPDIDPSLRSGSNARLDLEEPKAPPKRTPRMILAEVAGDEMAAAFIDYRRKSRKPFTDVAATRLASSLTKISDAGHSAADALGLAIERGWQSVSLDWYLNATKATRLNGSGGHEKTFAQRMIDKHLTDAERAALRGPGR